jgi:surfactin synthase thioesterase subunit
MDTDARAAPHRREGRSVSAERDLLASTSAESVRCHCPRPSADVRLVCLPHAGGGASAFHAWGSLLPDSVEVLVANLPGRESRFAEPPATSVDEVVAELAVALAPRLAGPWVLLGHSLGALLAFELARVLRQDASVSEPVLLFASAHPAPHLPRRHHIDLPEDDREAVAALRRLGGTPAAVLDDRPLIELVLPAIRADLRIAREYEFTPGRPLGCKISMLGGSNDPLATAHELEAWREHTLGEASLTLFDGGHFFLWERGPEVLRKVTDDIERALARRA